MGRRRSNSGSFLGENGGIAGSGIFGYFGTMINCSSSDNSLYCNFMKIFNILMIVGIILVVLYYIYIAFSAKRRR
jgi:hypothetical protein